MKDKKKNFTDLIAGVTIMAIAAFFYWTTFGTKSFLGTGRGRVAPDTIPKIVAGAMFVLGIVIVINWLIAYKKGKLPEVEIEDDAVNWEGLTQAQIRTRCLFQKITMPITITLIFLYIFFMPKVGFTISTFFFLLFQITLLSTDFSTKSWIKSLIIALVAAVGIYLIFGCAFGLAIPKVSFIDLGLSNLYLAIFG